MSMVASCKLIHLVEVIEVGGGVDLGAASCKLIHLVELIEGGVADVRVSFCKLIHLCSRGKVYFLLV